MRLAVIGVFLLLSVSIAWAVEPCLDNDCEVIRTKGSAQCEVVPCHQTAPQPACAQPCDRSCTPSPGKCQPAVCPQECEPDCPFGMDALMAGSTEIPLPPAEYTALDPDCCPRAEFRRIPCEEWCTQYTTCCWPAEYELLCQPECECPPPPPNCRQDTCTEPGGCQCADQAQGIAIGCDS